jgi:GntR family transcriptional regulator
MVAPLDMFTIATGSTEPIYRQLVDGVRRRVAAGQLRAGEEMPSVRDLAQALAVNPMTVSKAFQLLEAAGVLARRRGLAMVVAEPAVPREAAADRLALLRPTLARAAAEAQQLGLSPRQVLGLFERLLETAAEPRPSKEAP